MWPNPQEIVDLVTFTEEILGVKPFCALDVTSENCEISLDET